MSGIVALLTLSLLAIVAITTVLVYRKFYSWKATKDYALRYPLHRAVLKANNNEVERLLKEGVETSEVDDKGHTPLHWAVFGGYHDIAVLLLKYGADVNAITTDGVSSLWLAEDFGLDRIADLLRANGGESIYR